MRRELGDAFIAVEIDSAPGNPHGHPKKAHSVLTEHLVDEEGTPTRAALDQTLTFFREKLGVGSGPGPRPGRLAPYRVRVSLQAGVRGHRRSPRERRLIRRPTEGGQDHRWEASDGLRAVGDAPTRAHSRSAMSEFVMTIGGETAPTEDTFGVRNPATGEVFAQAPECTRQQLDAAFDAAAKAARDWKADEAARRAALLQGGRRAHGLDGATWRRC